MIMVVMIMLLLMILTRLYHAINNFSNVGCGKIYWEGGHLKGIRSFAQNLDAKLVSGTCSTTFASC